MFLLLLFVYSSGSSREKLDTIGVVRFLYKFLGCQFVVERIGVFLGVLDAGR
jgi:hypothetical protein